MLSQDFHDLSRKMMGFSLVFRVFPPKQVLISRDSPYLVVRFFGFPVKDLGCFARIYRKDSLFTYFTETWLSFAKFCHETSFVLVDSTPFSMDLFTYFASERVFGWGIREVSGLFARFVATSWVLSWISCILSWQFLPSAEIYDFPAFEGFSRDFHPPFRRNGYHDGPINLRP